MRPRPRPAVSRHGRAVHDQNGQDGPRFATSHHAIGSLTGSGSDGLQASPSSKTGLVLDVVPSQRSLFLSIDAAPFILVPDWSSVDLVIVSFSRELVYFSSCRSVRRRPVASAQARAIEGQGD